MKAIRVRYNGPTDHRGARYTASIADDSGAIQRTTMPQDNRLEPEQNALKAAERLIERLGWRDWFRDDRHSLCIGSYRGDWYINIFWHYKAGK